MYVVLFLTSNLQFDIQQQYAVDTKWSKGGEICIVYPFLEVLQAVHCLPIAST